LGPPKGKQAYWPKEFFSHKFPKGQNSGLLENGGAKSLESFSHRCGIWSNILGEYIWGGERVNNTI